MSKGNGFAPYTYGVGLEFQASSFKQVKDELKLNLDNLSKMVKSYGKVLKIDPNADLSKLFEEMRKIQVIVDGISSSDNSFAGFVDKGVLDRISALENGLQSVSATSEDVKTNLASLQTSIASTLEPLKASGQIKFPATFDNLFGNFKDQTTEIKNLTDQINNLKENLKTLDTLYDEIDKAYHGQSKIGIGATDDQVFDWIAKFDDLKDILADTKNMNFNELYQATQQITEIGIKLNNAFQNMSTDKLKSFGVNNAYITEIKEYIVDIGSTFDNLIATIKQKQKQLENQLESARSQQAKYDTQNIARTSSSKSLGIQPEYTAQVKVTPKTNESEWASKINDTIKNIEPQLTPVKLTPTFSKSKNIEKEIDGNLAQVNHAINVDLKVTDNIEQFNEKIKNIDTSIKNAKQQLEQDGNFKIKFEYEEGGKFKDAAYKIIDKFKKIEANFYIANGKKFIQDVAGLREKAKSELKDIPANIVVGNQDSTLKSIDSLRSDIENKIGNINVKLNIQNMPEFTAQTDMIKDHITESYGKNSIGSVDNSAVKETENLSEAARKATEDLQKCKNILQSLMNQKFDSPEFLKLGDIDSSGKKIKDSTEKLKKLLQEYNELQQKINKNRSTEEWLNVYPEANGNIKTVGKLLREDSAKLKQLESELSLYYQKQIAYTQQRQAADEKILQTEKEIASVSKKTNDQSAAAKETAQLSMSAEEATKKIRSLNGTLTQQKKVLKDLETNGINSKSFIKLGEFDKESNSFKKNSQYIHDLINRYKELQNARKDSGGTRAVGEEASLRGKLSSILSNQKKYQSEIISQTQKELEAAKQISAAYKQVGSNKEKVSKVKTDVDIESTTKKIDEFTKKLNMAQSTLSKLQSSDFSIIGSTGLGDVKNRLGNSSQSFTDLINLYNKLIASQKELEKNGKTDSSEYVQYANILKGVEQQMQAIYNDQIKYSQSKVKYYEAQISKAKELLQIETQTTKEDEKQQTKSASIKQAKTSVDSVSTSVKFDSSTLNSLAKDATLKSIDGKVNSIMNKLGSGIKVTGSNISINADNVSVSGKGASSTVSSKTSVKDVGEKEVNITKISTYSQQLVALEERIKRTGLYTEELQKQFANLFAQLNAIKVQDDADTYKFDLDRFKENFEQIKTYDKLYQDFIKSQAKQIELYDRISTSNGPTAELQEQLKIEEEVSKNIETQLSQYTTLYNQRARQLAIDEAIKRANQEIEKSAAAQSDKEINKQNNDITKIVNDAQKKFNEMQYAMSNFKIPMAEPAIAKLKEYEQLLTTLKAKQQEIAANPDLLKNADYSKSFNELLLKMQSVQKEFGTLQKSSENFLSKIKSIEDIKPLGSTFDANNLSQLHNEMQEFANQAGIGAAKLIEFNDVEKTATFTIQNEKGQLQQLTVEYDAATKSLGRFTSKTKESQSEVQKFISSLKTSFQNVARYVASFGSVYRIFAIIKQGITYVKEIDSALTELKKVTDETDKTYQNFLKTMSDVAGVVGSTTSELTQSAADWARLGYSIEEAGELAKNTAILMNVSEFDDVNTATEALISSLQAFGYEANNSIEIVDKLNIVGNNFAISSDGIASGLQRSASTLVAAGNSLEQSIAMLAAGNKVIQDPETLGKVLPRIKTAISVKD